MNAAIVQINFEFDISREGLERSAVTGLKSPLK